MLDGTVLGGMIDWLADCDTVGRSESDIVDAVQSNYAGGVEQFMADGAWYQITSVTWVWQRYPHLTASRRGDLPERCPDCWGWPKCVCSSTV